MQDRLDHHVSSTCAWPGPEEVGHIITSTALSQSRNTWLLQPMQFNLLSQQIMFTYEQNYTY